jgi:hypothetical protein
LASLASSAREFNRAVGNEYLAFGKICRQLKSNFTAQRNRANFLRRPKSHRGRHHATFRAADVRLQSQATRKPTLIVGGNRTLLILAKFLIDIQERRLRVDSEEG